MFFRFTVLTAAIFLQAVVVFSQQQQNPRQPSQGFVNPSITAAEMWNPYTWITPFYIAASKSWTDYLQKTQEASHQLYQQWEKTGAKDAIALGMQYAQLAIGEVQKGAEAAMNQAKGVKPQSQGYD